MNSMPVGNQNDVDMTTRDYQNSATIPLMDPSSVIGEADTFRHAHEEYCQLLDSDPRPTFVLDLKAPFEVFEYDPPSGVHRASPKLQFCNAALQRRSGLIKAILATSKETFVRDVQHSRMSVFGMDWTCFVIRDRWKIVSASLHGLGQHRSMSSASSILDSGLDSLMTINLERKDDNLSPSQGGREHPISPSEVLVKGLKRQHLDGSSTPRVNRIIGTSAHATLIRRCDWAATDIGPIETWSEQLLGFVNLMLTDPSPAILHWGYPSTMLYNEAAIPIIADRHPQVLGARSQDAYADVWQSFGSMWEEIFIEGKACHSANSAMSLLKRGALYETFFDFTFVPVFDSAGQIVGSYEHLYDATAQNLARRRTQTLLDINDSTKTARSVEDIWRATAKAADANQHDLPQLLVFSATSATPSDMRQFAGDDYQECVLETSVGYKTSDSTASLEHFQISSHSTGLNSLFKDALTTDDAIHVHKLDSSLPTELWDALEPRSFGDSASQLAVFAVRPTSSRGLVAFLVVGLNTRLDFDDSYRDFINLLRRQISSSVASVMLFEEELRRGQTAVQQTSLALQQQTDETKLLQLKLSLLASNIPVGLLWCDPDGSLLFANALYYTMTGTNEASHPRGRAWWSEVFDLSSSNFLEAMETQVYREKEAIAFELKLRNRSEILLDPTEDEYMWVLCSVYPEVSDRGMYSVVACLTNISEQKRAEGIQRRRVEEVEESKRQQENFIDITSHEIRNPLSVVLQCGEEILDSFSKILRDAPISDISTTIPLELIRNTFDAAETIEYCTLHQKRIIDDILCLSKLESGLLPVIADRSQPLEIAQGVMKIFDREMRLADIDLNFVVAESFREHHLEEAELDAGRFSQMIINLLSNAVKFTKTQSRRRITIIIAASRVEFGRDNVSEVGDIHYLPHQASADDKTLTWTWATSDVRLLKFFVQDTGGGINSEEQKLLFQRFSQASPRTHVKYGGSGLGLYICRALAEMHGGQIGFTSEEGVGSTFGFYIKVRPLRGSSPPAIDIPTAMHDKRVERTLIPHRSRSAPSKMSDLSRQTAGSAVTEPREEKYHIMIVEDNVINQKVLRRQLEKLGHKVIVANHGQEALDLLEQTHFWRDSDSSLPLSIVLMDMEMPILGGVECTLKIRQLQSENLIVGHVPLIAITGNARDEKVDMIRQAGIDEVVLKPFKIQNLMPMIARLVDKDPP